MKRLINQYNSWHIVKRNINTASNSSTRVIGVDLGTTNSAVAYIPNGNTCPQIIENDIGGRTTPSIVGYTISNNNNNNDFNKVLVGELAKRQQLVNSKNTFYATKRLIGKKTQDIPSTELSNLQYKTTATSDTVHETNDQDIDLVLSNGEKITPFQVGAEILKYLKDCSSKYLNENINKAVITVPAYFNDSQRQATKQAGVLAGLKVLRVVNEPTAAALAFGLNNKENGIIAVYDLGGGTFDISILDIENGVFEVRATNGDTHLGGEDFDNILIDYALEKFLEGSFNGKLSMEELRENKELMQRIKDGCEQAKIALSHVTETTIDIPFAVNNKHLKLKITEEELDIMTLHLIKKTLQLVKKCLKDADLEPEDVDQVIFVGGMTRMPRIRKEVGKLFPETVKLNTSVNPDETVALGAAIQGGVLSGEIQNVLLLDVTPLTLGIETYGGVFSPLIPRNTTVPIKKTEIFSTGVDGQTGVDIRVFQGERGMVKDNKLIGDLKLSGIPALPKGVPQIHVTFDIDADGIINVSASEKSSGKTKSITVIANSGLTEEEVSKMIQEANEKREQDSIIKTNVEILTKADIMISDTEASFEKYRSSLVKVDSGDQYKKILMELQKLRKLIDEYKLANEKNDIKKLLSIERDYLKESTDQVQHKSLKLFQHASKLQKQGN
ncbi:Hsp70 family ATPase SSQ1 SCDLUD_005250 [Saccharomycodes ludwigii]|uniref:Hsp70 family ATPase SSQ1 n=1 Tax=Saccharomycodes ludwigii TaxID=36035 RepID=UPI001E874E63|nr:hypothetical protein SCDLUD_005250 [Saccharomycodes ludwigii]KAH3898906.1 hypothetical protein SCDLUD_005250 [Saccharomycodes ludwigii]